MAQPESKLSRAIKAMIRARGGYCIKIHGGPTMEAGTPDILACIPVLMCFCGQAGCTDHPTYDGYPIGLFVGLETKMPDGGDPAPIQSHRHKQIRKAYGHVIVPRSVQDAVQALEALGMVRPPADDG